MDVTDSFMGLPLEVIDCQNKEDIVDCKTRHHLKNVFNNCGCLPMTIGSFINNVKAVKTFNDKDLIFFFQGINLCAF